MVDHEASSLDDRLSLQARELPEATAVLQPRASLTFLELARAVWGTARHLHRQGVRRGDVVAELISDEPTLLVSLLASARIGATSMTLAANTPPLVLDEALARTRCRFVVADAPRRSPGSGCALVEVDQGH